MKKLFVIVAIVFAGVNFVNAQQNFMQSFGQSVKSDISASQMLKNHIGKDVYLELGENAKVNELKMYYYPADTIWINKRKKNNQENKNYKLVTKYKMKDSTYRQNPYDSKYVDVSYTPIGNVKDHKFTLVDINQNVLLKDEDGKIVRFYLGDLRLNIDIKIPEISNELTQNMQDSVFYYSAGYSMGETFSTVFHKIEDFQIYFFINLSHGKKIKFRDPKGRTLNLTDIFTEDEYNKAYQKIEEERIKYASKNYYLKKIQTYPIGDTLIILNKYSVLHPVDAKKEVVEMSGGSVVKTPVGYKELKIIGYASKTLGKYYLVTDLNNNNPNNIYALRYARSERLYSDRHDYDNDFTSVSHCKYIKEKYYGKKFAFTDKAYEKAIDKDGGFSLLEQSKRNTNVTLEKGMEWTCSDFIVGFPRTNSDKKAAFLILTNSLGEKLCVKANSFGQGTFGSIEKYRPPVMGKDIIYYDDYLVETAKLAEEKAKKEAEILKKKKEEERKKAEEIKAREERNKQLREERLMRLKSKYSDRDVESILSGRLRIGMTKEMCRESWGEPKRVNKTTTAYGVREQWVYSNSYLYFENGILTTIQN